MANNNDASVTITAADPNQSPYGMISPLDRDLMIRTVIGEAGNDPGSAPGVAHVVLNRLQSGDYGSSIPSILFAPSQFEAWDRSGPSLLSISPDSSQYKWASSIVDKAVAGAYDPTNGATQYYSPSAQAALGRQPPSWDDGTGVMIGKQKFFGGSAVPTSSTGFFKDFGVAVPGAPASQPDTLEGVPSAETVPVSSTGFFNDFNISPIATTRQAAALETFTLLNLI